MKSSLLTHLAATGFFLILSMAGCSNQSDNAGTPAPSTSSTAEENANPDSAVAEIRMSATGLSLIDNSGTELTAINYTDDPATAVTTLTEALGTEPTIEAGKDGPGNNGHPPGTSYRWDGFVLQTLQKPDDPTQHEMGANFLAPELGDIRLLGPNGVQVGNPSAKLPAPLEVGVGAYEGDPNGRRYLLGTGEPGEPVSGDPRNYFVQGFTDAENGINSGLVAELIAPVDNIGGPWEFTVFSLQ
ncbi:MAG: hypothetical protein ACRCSP_10140 [Rhodoglobus sp.]